MPPLTSILYVVNLLKLVICIVFLIIYILETAPPWFAPAIAAAMAAALAPLGIQTEARAILAEARVFNALATREEARYHHSADNSSCSGGSARIPNHCASVALPNGQ